jgi:predicted O-methyltransferase YrrM
VANPTRRDAETVALREVAKAVRDDDRLVPVLLPLSDGLLVAAKTQGRR